MQLQCIYRAEKNVFSQHFFVFPDARVCVYSFDVGGEGEGEGKKTRGEGVNLFPKGVGDLEEVWLVERERGGVWNIHFSDWNSPLSSRALFMHISLRGKKKRLTLRKESIVRWGSRSNKIYATLPKKRAESIGDEMHFKLGFFPPFKTTEISQL